MDTRAGHCAMRIRTKVRGVVCEGGGEGRRGARGCVAARGRKEEEGSKLKGRRRDGEERECLCGVGGWVDRCDWWTVRCEERVYGWTRWEVGNV